MGRRGDHTFQELSDMIVDAAYEILEKDGYSALSTRKIAAKIGYTVGTLYNVFQNLDEIFLHINARTIEKITTELNGKFLSSDVSKKNIKILADYYLNFSKTNFNIWSTLFEYRFGENTKVPKWYTQKIDQMYFVVQEAVAPSMKNRDEKQLKEIITTLWSCIHGICILSVRGKFDRAGVESASALVDNFISNYTKGLDSTSKC